MLRKKLNFSSCALSIHLPKITIVLTMLLALGMSMPLNLDAQRGGGSRSGGNRGGGSHFSSGFSGMGRSSGSIGRISGNIGRSAGSNYNSGNSRINSGRSFSGNYGHREFYDRDFHGIRGYYGYRGMPYWRYSYLPFWGDYFWGIPPYSFMFYLNGYNYYDCDGVYFKKENDKYQVVAAPVGYKVKKLPKGSMEFTLDGVKYYYYFGTYYSPVDNQYEVVQPPLNAEVDSIPDGYDKVMIDGQTYYTLNGVQYKAVLRDNVIWYQVIKNNSNDVDPANASTNESPKQDNDMNH